MKIKKNLLILGIIFVIIGIILSVIYKEPHFYAWFSLGLFIILITIYNSISEKPLFYKWKIKKYFIFLGILILTCIIIDKIGIYLNYWTYLYNTLFDEVLKYMFEWAVAFLYFMVILLVGMKIFQKNRLGKTISFVLSLIIFVTITGLITEYINQFVGSWIVLNMPLTNYKIRGYYLIFQTIGYWLMAIIPLIIYKFVNKIK